MLRLVRSSGMLRPTHAAGCCCRHISNAILSSLDSPTPPPPLRPLPLPEDERAILEERLGYTFRYHTLLDDALTHTSYPNRRTVVNTFGEIDRPTLRSYKFFKAMGEHTIRERLKSDNSPFPFLLNLNLSPHKLARTAIRLKLFDFLRHNSPKLDRKVHDFIKEQEGVIPYRGIPPRVPTVLPDLVHAMLGAIIEDCGYSKVDLAWQKMRLYLEPFFLSGDLEKPNPRSVLLGITKEHGFTLQVSRDKVGFLYTIKYYINGKLHGSASSSTSESEADVLAALAALNKLPKYMLTGTTYDTPLGRKDKLESLLDLGDLSAVLA